MEVLKISSKSNPNSVAGAIAGLVKESNKAEMQAIGAGALNQAVKAVAIARGFVAPAGVDLICIPAFAEVEVEGEERTGIKLIVLFFLNGIIFNKIIPYIRSTQKGHVYYPCPIIYQLKNTLFSRLYNKLYTSSFFAFYFHFCKCWYTY